MQNRIYACLMIGVSAVGLISCSQDKTQQDDWQVSAPVLKSRSQGGSEIALHSGFSGEVAADGVFTFPSNSNDGFQVIKTHTECSRLEKKTAALNPGNDLSSGKAVSDKTFSGSSSIALASLLPDEFIFAFANEKLNCKFGFQFENQAGSSRTFESRLITVSNFKSLENFNPGSANFTVETFKNIDLSAARRSARAIGAELSVHALVCETFHNTRLLQKKQNDQDILKELAEGEITFREKPAVLIEDAEDSRYSDSVQLCKLVIQNQATGHATDVITSSPFTLSFPAPQPNVTITRMDGFAANRKLQGSALVNLSIENSEPAPVTYRLSVSDLGFSAQTHGLLSGSKTEPHFSFLPFGTTIEGRLEIKTHAHARINGNQALIEIPANQTVEVTLEIVSNFDCLNRNSYDAHNGLGSPECNDWEDCRVVTHLDVALPARVSLARLTHHRTDFTRAEETRYELNLIDAGSTFRSNSNALDYLKSQSEYEVALPAGIPLTNGLIEESKHVSWCRQ